MIHDCDSWLLKEGEPLESAFPCTTFCFSKLIFYCYIFSLTLFEYFESSEDSLGNVNMQTSKWCEQNENTGWERRAEILPLPSLPSLRHSNTVNHVSLSFFSWFLWFVIFLLEIILHSWSLERKVRDCDWQLIHFQMHWRRYQKIILSNLDYIWFVENAEWISKMFFSQQCFLSVAGSWE